MGRRRSTQSGSGYTADATQQLPDPTSACVDTSTNTQQARPGYRLRLELKLSLAALFFSEAFVYTIIDPYLPRAFPVSPPALISITFGAYSITQLAITVVLVLLQTLPSVAALRPKHDYFIVTAALGLFTAAGCITTALPDSIVAMLVQRVLLGLAAAVYFVHAYKGVARGLSPQDCLKAVAYINIGLVAGDSLAPIAGDILFRAAGVRLANGIQPAVCAAALLLLMLLPANQTISKWHKQRKQQRLPHYRTITSTGSVQRPLLVVCPGLVVLDPDNSRPVTAPVHKAADKATLTPRAGATLSELKDVEESIAVVEIPRAQPPAIGSHDGERCSFSVAAQLGIMWACLSNPSLLAHMLMLVLTQFARSLATILIPEALKEQPAWIVPTAFSIQALLSMTSPFMAEAALARWPQMAAPALMAGMSAMFAVGSGASLFVAAVPVIAGLFACCAVAGASYSALEVLVFHRINQITAAVGRDLAVDLGAILYTFFYCAGNTLGGMVGGAIAHMNHGVQAYLTMGLAVLIGSYGIAVSCIGLKL